MGEFTDLWNAISKKQICRFENREPKRYSGERPQNFEILLTPVVDNDAMRLIHGVYVNMSPRVAVMVSGKVSMAVFNQAFLGLV